MLIFIKNDLVYSCVRDFSLEKSLPMNSYLINEKEITI